MTHSGSLRAQAPQPAEGKATLGFDLNLYPGDVVLPVLRRHFSFVGYWLNTPPGATTNTWVGKRKTLDRLGFGFLVLWNGRLDVDLHKAGRAARRTPAAAAGAQMNTAAQMLGERDGRAAVEAAKREGFPAQAILFLDQEEGGRLLPEQAAYLFAWTETVARAGFRPGVYGSGQPVTEAPGQTITTAQDISAQVRARHLHPIALWVAQDSCGPAPGCVLTAPDLDHSGTPDVLVWQYAQSPRRPELTHSCAPTYAATGECVIPELPAVALDLNVSRSADPSRGRD